MKQQAMEYLKDRYQEESSRFSHLEEKCGRFISLITIIIAVITGILSVNSGEILRPESKLEWASLSLFLLAYFTIICCWGHSLSALKIQEIPILPRSIATADYIYNKDEATSERYIYDAHKNTIHELSIVLNNKVKYLSLAYEELVISAWLLSAASVIEIYMEIAK